MTKNERRDILMRELRSLAYDFGGLGRYRRDFHADRISRLAGAAADEIVALLRTVDELEARLVVARKKRTRTPH